jgi:predicted nucleic acid-binding protein
LKKESFYIDSNVFIYPVIYDENVIIEARRAREFLLKITSGEIEAYTSCVTWDEMVWVIRKLFGVDLSSDLGRKFLVFPNLRFSGVKRATVFKAQEIVEKYKLTPRDAIHAAAAIENKITTIVSYDKDFDILNEIRRIEP